MSDLNDRGRAFETEYATREEARFKAEARACKATGLWAASLIGLGGAEAEAYADTIVAGNLKAPGLEDVIARLKADLEPRGIADDQIRGAVARFLHEAQG